MNNLLIFRVLKQKRYLVIFFVFSLSMAGFYPILQVARQGVNNFFFWFSLLKPFDWIFYTAFCFLFGLNFSLFSWRNDNKICSAKQKLSSGLWSGLGSFLSVTLPLCPSCLSFLALLLPIGFLGVLMQYRFWLMLASAGLMFASLVILGAFDRAVSFQLYSDEIKN